LLENFKLILKHAYTYIETYATDINNDIVAVFNNKKGIPL